MKKVILLPLAWGLFCCASISVAQTKDKAPTGQAQPDRKLIEKTVIPKEPLKEFPSSVRKPERIGEIFRLWLSINPTDYSDTLFARQPPQALVDIVLGTGPRRRGYDPGFECYGFLKIDDVVRWRALPGATSRHLVSPQTNLLPNPNAQPAQAGPDPLKLDPRKQGYPINRDLYNPAIPENGVRNSSGASTPERTFEVTYNKQVPKSGQVRLELKLTDRDAIRPGYEALKAYLDTTDDVFGDFKTTLDLTKLGQGDGHYYWFWKGTDDQGKTVGSQLYLHVEHVRGLYQSPSTGKEVPKPRIEPKIVDKKIPGGGPGPINVKPQVKKAAPIK